MVDTTHTNISTDNSASITDTETISTYFISSDISRHDSQIEIKNYYINYIDDLSIQPECKTLEMNACRLELSQLPEEVIKFLLNQIKYQTKI